MSKDASTYDISIPTYEQATSSRTHTPLSQRGPHEISDDAERQGLIGRFTLPLRDGNSQPPTIESARSSYETDITEPEAANSELQDLHQDMQEMEVVDTLAERRTPRARMKQRLSKRMATLSEVISALQLSSFFASLSIIDVIRNRLPEWFSRYKLSWPIIIRLISLIIVVASVYLLVVVRVLKPGGLPLGQIYDQESVRHFIQAAVDPKTIARYLYQISFSDHIAGTKGDYFLADWVEEQFKLAKLDNIFTDDYEVYLNYPKVGGRRVAIIAPTEFEWEAALEEDVVNENPGQTQSPVFHGHSKAGNVTGPLIYANYGAREDFAWLKSQGVDLSGTIVLVRYYGLQGDRALKVKAAELAGAAGCLIYSDPSDDGFLKGKVWPDGPWRTSDSVQRGAVSLMSWVIGDVLTPGWASTRDAHRISKDDSPGLVNIPSIPLAWRDAKMLLNALHEHGRRVPPNWVGGVPDIGEWWTGSPVSSPTVQLMNIQDESEKQPIRNVLGRIQGIETPDKAVYVGNHRDAWCFGAVDPGSGTAVLLEVVRIFGQLMEQGWRPRRSIIFASWDGEEYNLIGSTEHVEERIDSIRADGVAYLNVDVGVSGHELGSDYARFFAAASPLFEKPLLRVLGRVADPVKNITLRQLWEDEHSKLEGLGAGSDYVAFQDLAGCSSIDFGFHGPKYSYPYHSCYETFGWMSKYGDPHFIYHSTLAQVWALLILEIADEAIVPYDFPAYAREVSRYVADLKTQISAASRRQEESTNISASRLDLTSLEKAAELFVVNAAEFMKWEEQWSNAIMAPGMMETREMAIRRISHNTRMSNFETHLLDLPQPSEGREGGVPGRQQFKHVIFGPQAWSGYDEAYFPAIRDAMEVGNWTAAQEQLEIVARILAHAADKLLY